MNLVFIIILMLVAVIAVLIVTIWHLTRLRQRTIASEQRGLVLEAQVAKNTATFGIIFDEIDSLQDALQRLVKPDRKTEE